MVLITGATGLVGVHLLFNLSKENESVAALYRYEERKNTVFQFFAKRDPQHPKQFRKVVWHQGSLNDINALEKAFEGVTHVFHCAAFVSLFHHHANKLHKVNVEGTANVVNLALEKGIKKLIYISSIAALGSDKKKQLIDENAVWNVNGEHTAYAHSKFEAEMEVWRGTQEGLCAVILNPGVILSTDFWHRSSGKIMERIAKGLPFYPTGKLAIVGVEDVVKACLLGFNTSALDQNRFILVAQNLTYQSFITTLSKGFSKSPPRYELSRKLLKGLLILESIFQKLSGRKRQLSKGLIETFCSKLEYDGTKIEKTAAFQYMPNDQLIEQLLNAYKG
jgi:dihydroflavonol-4-reductase